MDAWLDAAPVVRARLGQPAAHVRPEPSRSRGMRLTPRLIPKVRPFRAAGLPWFMAVFGRDSLITSYQALPFVPQLASATLQVLARRRRQCGTTSETPSLADPPRVALR